MSAEFCAIVGVGVVLLLALLKLSERLERITRLLEGLNEYELRKQRSDLFS